MNPRQAQRTTRHRGTVLIVVMGVVFALASLVVTLGRHVRAEALATANATAMHRADAAARGAEQFVLALLSERKDSLDSLDERDFAAVSVGRDLFWIVRPPSDDPREPTFGLVDETGKLDLNLASRDVLRRLPGMTDELAASIVDWRDADDASTDGGGAESAAYLAQSPAYHAKNAGFETVEELLMVRGMTAELLYGRGDATTRSFNGDRLLRDGLFDQLTVWTRQTHLAPDGSRRIDVTDNQREGLGPLLRRQLGTERGNQVFQALGPQRLIDVFDLAARGQLQPQEFEAVVDYLSSGGGRVVRGRVNVNTASRQVLRCLEGLDPADADLLFDRRPDRSSDQAGSIAWVWEVLRDKAIGLGPQITGRGQVFSADIVAASGDGRAFKRVRLVVDASRTTPRIVYRRDLTDLGWPLDRQILTALRAGQRDAVTAAHTDGFTELRS